MTEEEYFAHLKEQYEQVDWNDREAIRRYNEYKRMLRKEMEKERNE